MMSTRRTLYENQYIGAFIYALGLHAGSSKGPESLNALSLMQQTPLDTQLGDLFTAWEGRSFLFEFKRTEKDAKREFEKNSKKDLIRSIQENAEINALSLSSHFLCYARDEERNTTLLFQQYALTKNDVSQEGVPRKSLAAFIPEVLENKNHGLNFDQMTIYKTFLLENLGRASSGVSGAVINIDKNGNPNIVKFESLLDLDKKLELLNQKTQQISQELSR
ncbi:MAG: hypothetical protein WA056_00280 [Gallionella sp.]